MANTGKGTNVFKSRKDFGFGTGGGGGSAGSGPAALPSEIRWGMEGLNQTNRIDPGVLVETKVGHVKEGILK